jgi:hypothetical protein
MPGAYLAVCAVLLDIKWLYILALALNVAGYLVHRGCTASSHVIRHFRQ